MVVGDRNGHVGIGMGKSQEVPTAIKKGVEDAKKNMFSVPLTDEKTLPHEIIGEFGAGRVLIKPAAPVPVICGRRCPCRHGAVRRGDVLCKSLGTDNVMNVVKATAEGLKKCSPPSPLPSVVAFPLPRSTAGRSKVMSAKKTLRLTQVKSSIGYKKDQAATLRRPWVSARSAVPSTGVDNPTSRRVFR